MPPSRAPPLSWSWTGSSGRAPAMEVASSAAAAVARAFRSRAAAVALARTRSAASASSFGTDGSFVLLCSCRALSSIALSCARLAASSWHRCRSRHHQEAAECAQWSGFARLPSQWAPLVSWVAVYRSRSRFPLQPGDAQSSRRQQGCHQRPNTPLLPFPPSPLQQRPPVLPPLPPLSR